MSVERVRRVVLEEAKELQSLAGRIDQTYADVVSLIKACRGRIVCCGLGKSGHIANKTAATLASTGTAAHFMHAAEALHGDLGMVGPDDVVLLYSYSGETEEIVKLMPAVRAQGATSILVCGRPESSAALAADLVLDVSVDSEACPNNLAPTTSTTAMLALSDALAVAVMEERGFGPEDFAKLHPAGALGRRLTLRVADVMRKGDDLPVSAPGDSVLDVMREISKVGAGCTCIVDAAGLLLGLITEGDLRRWIVATDGLAGTATDLMTVDPRCSEPGLLATEALEAFQNSQKAIGEMPVTTDGVLVGLLMLKDLLRSGIV